MTVRAKANQEQKFVLSAENETILQPNAGDRPQRAKAKAKAVKVKAKAKTKRLKAKAKARKISDASHVDNLGTSRLIANRVLDHMSTNLDMIPTPCSSNNSNSSNSQNSRVGTTTLMRKEAGRCLNNTQECSKRTRVSKSQNNWECCVRLQKRGFQ